MFDAVDFREQFDAFSMEELEKVKELADEALEERASQRYHFLVNQILTGIHCLEKEFPCSEINITYDGEDINLLDYTWDEDNFCQ